MAVYASVDRQARRDQAAVLGTIFEIILTSHADLGSLRDLTCLCSSSALMICQPAATASVDQAQHAERFVNAERERLGSLAQSQPIAI